MSRRTFNSLSLAFAILLLTGCAETEKQAVVRPIPPPPSTPSPGVIISAPAVVQQTSATLSAPVTASTNVTTTTNFVTTPLSSQSGTEVTTNIQIYPQSQQPMVAAADQGIPTSAQSAPQVEIVPERPGPDYVWADGNWTWGGTAWVWVPGRWVFRPEPRVIIVPGGGYYRHYHGGWRGRPY